MAIETWELERQRAWVALMAAYTATGFYRIIQASEYADLAIKEWERYFPKPE